jgi:hypothetical protein
MSEEEHVYFFCIQIHAFAPVSAKFGVMVFDLLGLGLGT